MLTAFILFFFSQLLFLTHADQLERAEVAYSETKFKYKV